jgi:hypothetical protein
LDIANAAHIDGGEEAGDVADDAATEGEEERVSVLSCWARDSTLERRLWDSPLGRKRTVGGSLKEARKGFDQRAQMLGEVMTKGRKGLSGLSLRRRGWRVRRRFEAMVTS